ncbi:MAG: glycosyltransferase [Chlamydiae bacterium]|nr:glycosyltransferase [Chlamydiota bacterium]
MSKPQITAVIPTYKRPELMRRAVTSMLAQSFTNFKIIICDNASGDRTAEVAAELMKMDSRVSYFQQRENLGAMANFQSGLQKVDTPFVSFLCDDDIAQPHFYESIFSLVAKYPDCGIYSGRGAILFEDGKITLSKLSCQPMDGYYPAPEGFFAILRRSHISFLASIYSTKFLKDLGGFDLRLTIGGDEYITTQLAAKHPIAIQTFDSPLVHATQHDQKLSGIKDFELFLFEANCLHEKASSLPFSESEKEEVDAFFYKRKLQIISHGYKHATAHGRFAEARAYCERYLKLSPSRKWKRKKALCLVPPLFHLNEVLRKIERKWRASRSSMN